MYVCSDKLRELLPSILPRLLELMQDSEYYVRECACFALGHTYIHIYCTYFVYLDVRMN
jgi:hypothetical protein